MSVAVAEIYCEGCGYKTYSSVIWGYYKYEYLDVLLPVERTFGWCYECWDIRPVEVLLEPSRLLQELKLADYRLHEAGKFTLGNLVNRLTGVSRGATQVFREQKEELELRIEMSLKRKSPPKCLTCGGSEQEALDLPSDWEDFPRPIGNVHPGCEGRLWIGQCPDAPRIMRRFRTRIYSPEGVFLRET